MEAQRQSCTWREFTQHTVLSLACATIDVFPHCCCKLATSLVPVKGVIHLLLYWFIFGTVSDVAVGEGPEDSVRLLEELVVRLQLRSELWADLATLHEWASIYIYIFIYIIQRERERERKRIYIFLHLSIYLSLSLSLYIYIYKYWYMYVFSNM